MHSNSLKAMPYLPNVAILIVLLGGNCKMHEQ